MLGLFVAVWLDTNIPQNVPVLGNLIWFAWIASLVYLAYRCLDWRTDWFVATNKRVILANGLLTRTVAMMPLAKVTDMSYNRSVLGPAARLRRVRAGVGRAGPGPAPGALPAASGRALRGDLPGDLRRQPAPAAPTAERHADQPTRPAPGPERRHHHRPHRPLRRLTARPCAGRDASSAGRSRPSRQLRPTYPWLCPPSWPPGRAPSQRLQRADHLGEGVLGVAEEQGGLGVEEQLVVDAGEARAASSA